MLKCLLVGFGGFVGTVSRYLVGLLFLPVSGAFPFGTLLINFAAAFLIGAFTGVFPKSAYPNLSVFLSVGVCGGFSTFSAFSLETLDLIEKGRAAAAAGYALLSVAICLLGVLGGKFLARLIAG